MTDARDTGEHFLGPLTDQTDFTPQVAASRIADLTAQIEFLDREIARYRDIVETERIRHSTDMANQQLEIDTQLDELRRQEREQIAELHASNRSQLAEHQLRFEQALTEAAAASADELERERERHQEAMQRERDRRDTLLEATRNQTLDEANEVNQQQVQSLRAELSQSFEAIDRLQHELEAQIKRADEAESHAALVQAKLGAAERASARSESRHQLQIEEFEKRLATATNRLDAERQRSAATLAEVLERSASIAAEADTARSAFAAEQAKADHAAAVKLQQVKQDFQAFADAADTRASQALQRESELEAVIAELRQHLGKSDQ